MAVGFSCWWRRQGISYMAAQMADMLADQRVPSTIRPFEKYEDGVHPRERHWIDRNCAYPTWLNKHRPKAVFFIHHCPLDQVQENVKQGVKSVYVVMWERFVDYEKSARIADVLVAPTAGCYQLLQNRGYANKTVYIPWMVPIHTSKPPSNGKPIKLLFAQGLPEPRRRGDFVFRAVNQMLKEDRDLELAVHYVGHLLPRDRLEMNRLPEVQLMANPDSVTHNHALRMADLFLWPTTREGLGLMGLEAIAVGTPVVAYDVPPLGEYLAHGVNASLAKCSLHWFRDGVPEVEQDEVAYQSYLGALRYALDNLNELKHRVFQGLENRQLRFNQSWQQLLAKLGL